MGYVLNMYIQYIHIWAQIPFLYYSLIFTWNYVDALHVDAVAEPLTALPTPLSMAHTPIGSFSGEPHAPLESTPFAAAAALRAPMLLTSCLGLVCFFGGAIGTQLQWRVHTRRLATDPAYRTEALIDNSSRSTVDEVLVHVLGRLVRCVQGQGLQGEGLQGEGLQAGAAGRSSFPPDDSSYLSTPQTSEQRTGVELL